MWLIKVEKTSKQKRSLENGITSHFYVILSTQIPRTEKKTKQTLKTNNILSKIEIKTRISNRNHSFLFKIDLPSFFMETDY
jgi:hypothetical protein